MLKIAVDPDNLLKTNVGKNEEEVDPDKILKTKKLMKI